MYLRMTQRRNRDGSTVAYYALAENDWNADTKRAEARVVHNFGRADQLDRAALQRLVNSINRVLDEDGGVTNTTTAVTDATPEAILQIEMDRVFELGVVLAARGLWEDLGIGAAIRRCIAEGELTAPHEAALFAMAANRLDTPCSKLACAARWLPHLPFHLLRRRNLGQLRPMSPSCPMPPGSPSISSTARSTSSPSGRTGSSARSFSRQPICSGSMSISSSTTPPRLISRSTRRTRIPRNGAGGSMRRCAGAAIIRKAATISPR